MRKVSIYSLEDPRDNIIKYIGKTVQKNPLCRYNQHIFQWTREQGNHNKLNNWIKLLSNLGLKPLFNIIDECDESNWIEYEKGYIKLFKSFGANLKNSTEGGDLQPTNSNTEEAKAKRLITLKTSVRWKDANSRQSVLMKERYKQGKSSIGLNKLSKEDKLKAIKKISENNPNRTVIVMQDILLNKEVEFYSIKEMSRYLGYKSSNSVRDFLFNKRKTKLHNRYIILSKNKKK